MEGHHIGLRAVAFRRASTYVCRFHAQCSYITLEVGVKPMQNGVVFFLFLGFFLSYYIRFSSVRHTFETMRWESWDLHLSESPNGPHHHCHSSAKGRRTFGSSRWTPLLTEMFIKGKMRTNLEIITQKTSFMAWPGVVSFTLWSTEHWVIVETLGREKNWRHRSKIVHENRGFC